MISLICASLCALGLLEYSVENRGEKLWVSQSSVSLDYQDWIDETFPKKFRQINVMLDSGTNVLTREGMLAVSTRSFFSAKQAFLGEVYIFMGPLFSYDQQDFLADTCLKSTIKTIAQLF